MTQPIKCAGPRCPTEYHRERNGWFMGTVQGKFTLSPWNPELEGWISAGRVLPICGFSCAAKLLDQYMQDAKRRTA